MFAANVEVIGVLGFRRALAFLIGSAARLDSLIAPVSRLDAYEATDYK